MPACVVSVGLKPKRPSLPVHMPVSRARSCKTWSVVRTHFPLSSVVNSTEWIRARNRVWRGSLVSPCAIRYLRIRVCVTSLCNLRAVHRACRQLYRLRQCLTPCSRRLKKRVGCCAGRGCGRCFPRAAVPVLSEEHSRGGNGDRTDFTRGCSQSQPGKSR